MSDEETFKSCVPTIECLCAKYAVNGSIIYDFDGLYSEAQLVFLKCLKHFDKTRKTSFKTFLSRCIINHFNNLYKKEIERYNYIVEIPIDETVCNLPDPCTCINSISDISCAVDLSANARAFLEIIINPPKELQQIVLANRTAYSPSIVVLMYLKRIFNFSFPEIYRIREEVLVALRNH